MKLYYLFFILLILISCDKGNQNLKNELYKEIKEKTNTNEPILTLVNTEFDWHLLYIIEDWYNEKAISNVIGFKWQGPSVEDQFYRMLFVDTVNYSTEYFDYYVVSDTQFYFDFKEDTVINGNRISYIEREKCIFTSKKVKNKYWKYEVKSLN